MAAAAVSARGQVAPPSWTATKATLDKYCAACHAGKTAVAGFDLAKFATEASLRNDPVKWTRAAARIREFTMPPKGKPSPEPAEREHLSSFIQGSLKAAACSDGITPMRAPVRRLNKAEYAATVRDLLNIHINAGHALPADGAGGEGFDNAAETLFLSPIHAEKYLEAAKIAVGYAMSDPRSRKAFLPPAPLVESPATIRRILINFLPRAFRRPVSDIEIDQFAALATAAAAKGAGFEDSLQVALQGVLLSPHFLFRIELPNTDPEPQPANDYAMASRLSYFLWGSMPDATLTQLAGEGKLQDPSVLRAQVARMLKDQKSVEFCERFVEQWLGTRELGRDIRPDAKLFPQFYDAEIQSGIKYEPILFFREIIAENLPLTNLIDSRFSVMSNRLARHYGLTIKDIRQQPVRVDLPEGSRRGGVVSMAAALAVSSMPNRTSPVLRGKWVLDALLGTPPPPPPPDVPELKDNAQGAPPKSTRERLEIHRANPACASCHNAMDPIGFGLENYDVLGRWRTEESGRPVDATGELPDGTRFEGPDGLKQALFARKDLLLRNVTVKLLGYALGRGLTLEDHCAVDQIVEEVKKDNYSGQRLVQEVVLSVPFRYQAGSSSVVANAPGPAARANPK